MPEITASSADPAEIAKFAQLATQWWDPDGAFAPLHKLNPIRLKFIRDVAAEHFGRDARSRWPFEGLSLLDLGCGGGLLSEPMARLGFRVLGCDAGEENVRAAAAHAASTGANVRYRCAIPEVLAAEGVTFDVVLAMEIVEHVTDIGGFLGLCSRLVSPGGLIFVATINRTLKSLTLAKIAAEYVLRWLPPGTHDWNRFIEPARLSRFATESGLTVQSIQGFAFDPLIWNWRLSADPDVNYVLVAERH
jgi:2-polyprenyl-6-hydroxyphenyl methylase / 3-demethylubiquinone-9 3-methyltransferase